MKGHWNLYHVEGSYWLSDVAAVTGLINLLRRRKSKYFIGLLSWKTPCSVCLKPWSVLTPRYFFNGTTNRHTEAQPTETWIMAIGELWFAVHVSPDPLLQRLGLPTGANAGIVADYLEEKGLLLDTHKTNYLRQKYLTSAPSSV